MNKAPRRHRNSPALIELAAGSLEDLVFTVELASSEAGSNQVIARTDSIEVAEAIYQAAVNERPTCWIVLRRGSQILRSTK